MPKIEQTAIDRIMAAARIEEVVADFLTLRKSGVRYLGLCPFHDDNHLGSFVVYPKGNCFRCFACDAKGGCVDFLMMHCKMSYPDAIRWLGRKYGIPTDNIPVNFTPPPARPAPPPLPMLELPMEMVTARQHTGADQLCNWLRSLPWDSLQRRHIEPVIQEYRIGHSMHGHTIFWQIDDQQRVRTGKMMLYRPDGHRDRESKWNFDYIHAALFRADNHPEYDADKQEMKQTLFGMHLIDAYGPDASVRIVESEKTAVFMAIAYGNNKNQVWMACGGAENLTRDRLEPIISRGRRIILYPDRDAIERWQQKADQLHYGRLTIDTEPVLKWWIREDGPKADIADVLLRLLKDHRGRQPQALVEVIEQNPVLQDLIDKFNLKPD